MLKPLEKNLTFLIFEENSRHWYFILKNSVADQEDISQLLETDNSSVILAPETSPEVLVHGKNGMLIRARTLTSGGMVESCDRTTWSWR